MTSQSRSHSSGAKVQKRSEPRASVKHSAVLHYKGTQIPVVLEDMSRGGARIAMNANRAGMALDGSAFLEVPGALKLPLKIRWQKNTTLGAAFDLPASRKATFQQQIDRVIARSRR